MKKTICILTAAVILIIGAPKTSAANLQSAQIQSFFSKDDSYYNYRMKYTQTLTGEEIKIDPCAYSGAIGTEIVFNKELNKNVLNTGAESSVTWTAEIKKGGSYAIKVSYLPLEGSGSSAARTVKVDGELPFSESYNIEFSRIFRDSQKITPDKNGNDIRPSSEEIYEWTKTYVRDSDGYYGTRLFYYLSEGTHTIEFSALKEPLAIGEISLISENDGQTSYEDALKSYREKGAKEVSGVLENGYISYEAENTCQKSDPTLYAVNDNTSAATTPYVYDKQKLNTIGGTRWQTSGQWISWEINVPQTGLYNIAFRFKQSYVRDIDCARELSIDGEIPFKEASDLVFQFNNKFQISKAGNKEPLLFYFTKGEHKIKMQVTLGNLSDILTEASASLSALNSANWYLLALLGSSPDIYKSYNIDTQLPQVIQIFGEQSKKIEQLAESWAKLTGSVDSNVSRLRQISFKLSKMVKDADLIPSMYSSFKDDISMLGDLIVTAGDQPLLLDKLYIAEPEADLPKAEVGFLTTVKYGVLKFFSSFFNDYNVISAPEKGKKDTIIVWIGNGITGGRDQALALNQLITQDFTTKYDIPVNLQLVPPNTILTATLAGVGPDVALQVSGSDPANYAMRNATVDLLKFSDFNAIKERFLPASYEGYKYQGGVYALPETMSFPMLFYRTDIMEMLHIDVNSLKTWQDIIAVLPVIQRLNMNFAVPAAYGSYVMFLYQMGGEIYNEEKTKTLLDSKTALDAFDFYMDLYTSYGLPYAYSFEMRFRTGEIPVGIADYTTYNLLQISAPEIKGKWEMTTIPGMKNADGTISNKAAVSGAGCVMMAASKNKENAWEFMKWWTDSEAQYRFGKELESVMGVAARYNTANLTALKELPWRSKDLNSLLSQISNLKGIPEVPGGYITARNVDFSIKSVYNNNLEARSDLLTYIDDINREITFKREEFGLGG